jgi:hypothetical protein
MKIKIIGVVLFLAAAGFCALPARSASEDGDGTPQGPRRVSDTDNTDNLLQSALGTHPALLAPVGAEEPAAADASAGAPVPSQADAPSASAAGTGPVFELPDLRDIAGTRRAPPQTMPEYSVNGAKIPVFRERDVYTKQGMASLSFKRHPGLLVGNQFNLNADAAYEMFLEDDWRATKSDYRSMAQAMILGGDRDEARAINRDVDSADLSVRNDAEDQADEPTMGQFKLNDMGGDSHLLEIQSVPFDLTVVKVKW